MRDDISSKVNWDIDLAKAIDTVPFINPEFQQDIDHQWKEILADGNSGQRAFRAIKEIAENTAESNAQLQELVDHQKRYIKLLEQQLDTLKNIFASHEDSAIIEKEMLKIIQERMDSNPSLKEFILDKSGDVAVAGILNHIPKYFPAMWEALKVVLISKGIMLN